MNSWHECSEFDFKTNAVALQYYMSITSWNCRFKSLTHTDSQLIIKKHDFYNNYKIQEAFWSAYIWKQSKKAMLICHKIIFQASEKHWSVFHKMK